MSGTTGNFVSVTLNVLAKQVAPLIAAAQLEGINISGAEIDGVGVSDAIASASVDALNNQKGIANGVAALASDGQLALTNGSALVPVASVTPATQSQPALLSLLIPLDGNTQFQAGDTVSTLAELLSAVSGLAGIQVYVDANGYVRKVQDDTGALPSDVTQNGSVFMTGATALPAGLSSNGGVIMTDGTVDYPGTYSNGGVLSAN